MNYCINIDYHYFCMHVMYSYSVTGTELNILYWSEMSMNKIQQNKLKYKRKSPVVLWHSTAAFLVCTHVFSYFSSSFTYKFHFLFGVGWTSKIAKHSSNFLNSVSLVNTQEKSGWSIKFSCHIEKKFFC